MMRQLIFLALWGATCHTSIGQIKTHRRQPPQKVIHTERPAVAILPFDALSYGVFPESKPAQLTGEDLKQIETILNTAIAEYNPEQESQFRQMNEKHPELKLDRKNFTIDLARYKRQYLAVINAQGDKEVWVNCFCESANQHWKKTAVIVKDGGNCYFQLKINLTKAQYYQFTVNGNP